MPELAISTHGDLTFGMDARGDFAFFMNQKHIQADGWTIDERAQSELDPGPTFFRLIDDEGKELHSHGWIEDNKIIQWG